MVHQFKLLFIEILLNFYKDSTNYLLLFTKFKQDFIENNDWLDAQNVESTSPNDR